MNSSKVQPETRTNVSVSAAAVCPFSIAQEYAVQYLRSAELGGSEAAIRIPLGASSTTLHHHVRLRFGLHLDILEEGRRHDEVRFNWTSGSRLLPDFCGTLRFRIDGVATQVLIDGSYQPPLGFAGALFDRLLGRRIAHASLQDFVNRLARYLGEQQQQWQKAV